MASRMWNGTLVTVVGKGVLINAGDRWTLHELEGYKLRSDEDLRRATLEDAFYLWFHIGIGGIDESTSN